MTSLADSKPAHQADPRAASVEADAQTKRPGVVRLDPFLYQEMQRCAHCGGLQIFVAVFECESGRMGFCLGCGEERFVRFSRGTEAA